MPVAESQVPDSRAVASVSGYRGVAPTLASSRAAQRGFLTAYIALGVGAVLLIMGIALKLAWSKNDALRKEVATIEASRDQWKGAAELCSKSVAEAAKASQDRANRAAVALKVAKTTGEVNRKEAERLKAEMGKQTVTSCPAGEATTKVREGLK